jgi:uncharacterized repeat protein (TIGR03833 family)
MNVVCIIPESTAKKYLDPLRSFEEKPMGPQTNGTQRTSVRIGLVVDVIQKEDQRSKKKTRGIVQEILTNSVSHPHGIKVRLKSGQVGRVVKIIQQDSS